MTCDYFIDAVNDPDFALKVRERLPKDLDSALRIALQVQVWSTDVDRSHSAAKDRKARELARTENKQDETTELLKKEVAEIQRQLTDLQRGNQAEALCSPKTEVQPTASSQTRPKTIAVFRMS